jgi:DNA-binding NarL/FixJ family response regulator
MPPLRFYRGRPLTPAEIRVASLVATGLKNHEVATILHVNLATVKAHLSHIYGKLGLANRVELALQWKDPPPKEPTE